MSETITVFDKQQNTNIVIENPYIYGPAIPRQDNDYKETGCTITIPGSNPVNVSFEYPNKPQQSSYEIDMWNTIDEFENKAWSQKNKGLTTGWKTIDDAFDGGVHPGFIIIGGESNIGKTAFLSQLAWQISVNNGDKVFVMDFSLDDAMADKLSRIAASAGKVIINAVKTPLNYSQYPLMLVRRKNALINIRKNIANYRAYDATFSTYIEDIEAEIENKLIYFKSNNIDKQLVVCIDNFHDLNTKNKPNMSDKEKYDFMAQWCADIAIKYDIVMICTGEFKKLNGVRRPVPDDLRESVKIKYEAKAILLVYNEVHYKGENSNIYFMKSNNPFKQPIFEVHFAKNKFNTFKGRVFFEFYPEMARMEECDQATQKNFTNQLYS
jgi:replicative DNA helicase